jgi:hypothetical protein
VVSPGQIFLYLANAVKDLSLLHNSRRMLSILLFPWFNCPVAAFNSSLSLFAHRVRLQKLTVFWSTNASYSAVAAASCTSWMLRSAILTSGVFLRLLRLLPADDENDFSDFLNTLILSQREGFTGVEIDRDRTSVVLEEADAVSPPVPVIEVDEFVERYAPRCSEHH